MGAKKYETTGHIGISCSKEMEQRFKDLAPAYNLNNSEFFQKVFNEWLESKGFTALQISKPD